MFEYWFHGLDDGHGTFTHHGTTHDFLEVCSRIAQLYSPGIASEFVGQLLEDNISKLDFLRVIDWKFEFDWGTEQKIVLHKLK